MKASSSGRRRGFTLLTILLVLIAIEVGFRAIVAIRTGPRALAYGFVADREHLDLDRHDDDRAGYSKYFPRQELRDRNPDTGESFVTRVNAQGFRGEDFEPKRPGTVRVVALGASSTFGYHLRDAETWPVRLEAELAARRPDLAWEVLNLGVPHLTAAAIATLYEAEGAALEPDFVLFYEGANDATPRRTRHALRRQVRRWSGLRSVVRGARDRLLLVKFVDDVLRPRVTHLDRPTLDAHLDGIEAEFLESLQALDARCAEAGARFVYCRQQARSLSVPREELAGMTYADERARVEALLDTEGRVPPPAAWFLAHGRIVTAATAWAEAAKVPVVDGIAALDRNRDTLWSWVHLSPPGNELLAAAIAEVVAREVSPRAEP